MILFQSDFCCPGSGNQVFCAFFLFVMLTLLPVSFMSTSRLFDFLQFEILLNLCLVSHHTLIMIVDLCDRGPT